MPYMLDGNCVHKKNADGSQGERVKCHSSRQKAEAHLKALYANVPDAKTESLSESGTAFPAEQVVHPSRVAVFH